MTFTLHFSSDQACDVSISGGKGANLAILTQKDFPVPTGFIITVSGYQKWIPNDECIRAAIAQFDYENPGLLKTQANQLITELKDIPLPEELTHEVITCLNEYPADSCFSVRSSSNLEDLADAAFAGQHETFLNCRGEDEILARIKDCYLSLWSDRAVAYRQKQGFNQSHVSMAVVIQTMIACEVAGVGFSIDPVGGDLNRMIIDANYGLGESVVSGEGEIDHFVIERSTRQIVEQSIGEKKSKIIAVTTGTEEVRISKEESEAPCLSSNQLKEVADLMIQVEECYAFPQDIEWGFLNGKLYLLQSRTVTTILPKWTRDESAERFPNVISPLAWDLVDSGFHRSLAYSFRLMGYPTFKGKWFAQHDHYIYGNQNAVMLYGRRLPFSFNSPDDLRKLIPSLRKEYRWVQELPVSWYRNLDGYLIRLGELGNENLKNRSSDELWNYVNRVNQLAGDYFLPNIAISITQGVLYRVLLRVITLFVEEKKAGEVFDQLMSFCETKTGQINRELYDLAELARRTPELAHLIREKDSQTLLHDKLLSDYSEFSEKFEDFLHCHGHREVDFDPYIPTWIDSPWTVVDNIRLILESEKADEPAEKERELKMIALQTEEELLEKIPQDLHFFFYEILRLARVYTSLDDLEHYQTTRLTLPLRRGLKALGENLVSIKVVETPMDIFFAHRTQLDRALSKKTELEWDQLKNLITDQKAAYHKDKSRIPEWVLGQSEEHVDESIDTLKGIPGSPGTLEGTVFQVLGPEDFSRFPKGAILVTRTTNPSWTPLFYSAVGLVTESGGPLSHGAVTAREMGIPAVMSVRNCLARLKNGTRIRINGMKGTVQTLD